MTSQVVRSIKNVAKGYSQAQIKVREATSNDAWGPTGTQMSDIAHMTFGQHSEFYEIMDMLDKRLNDKGKNWRHVLKALKVLDYCLHEGSELVVTWTRNNLYIIKTLREFIYIDEDGKDVGQNVRVAAKELTTLILDDDRLRLERSDRKSWKSRVSGLDEFDTPPNVIPQRRPRPARQGDNDEDTEYKLAIEASKHQEAEDRKQRAINVSKGEDDDIAKAIKLSREEEDARQRREVEDVNEITPMGGAPSQISQQPAYTGYNQGYQQGSAVDFFANPIDQGHHQGHTVGHIQAMSTGYQLNPSHELFNYNQTQWGARPVFADMAAQGQQTTSSPYSMQPSTYSTSAQFHTSISPQPGSNNPWANSALNQSMTGITAHSGSNNPFGTQFHRPQTAVPQKSSSMVSLPEQKSLVSFGITPSQVNDSLPQPLQSQQKPMNDHESRLNALLSNGEGMDTFGNIGNLRIPAQHTAPGTFVNSAGVGTARLAPDATGNNPFLRPQMTGLPTVGFVGQQQVANSSNSTAVHSSVGNPFFIPTVSDTQGNQQTPDLIQF